jgi:Kef-type K+ transport system membrane component KefB
MTELIKDIPSELVWPFVLLIAWLVGEFGHRWFTIPRISLYGLVGFLFALPHLDLFPPTADETIFLLANVAFGLMLFELGYRINLHWLRINIWLTVTGVVEAICTFIVVYAIATWAGVLNIPALLVAALAMSTSPAAVVRIVNEENSSGQVTERLLHLSAINSMLAVFAFKLILGLVIFQAADNVWDALYEGALTLFISVALGVLFGMAVPAMLRMLQGTTSDGTLVFAITVIFLVVLTYTLKLSPVLTVLTFGFMVRHRRIVMSPAQRNFGVLGDFLAVLLFVFIATTLNWHLVVTGLVLGSLIILARCIAKIVSVTTFSWISGITWRKGMLLGVAMTPVSALTILVLEQARYLNLNIAEQLAPLAAFVFILEIFAPILTQRALMWARETSTHAS